MQSKIIYILSALTCFMFSLNSSAQVSSKTDSTIKAILDGESLTGGANKGTELILQGNLSAADKFYDSELKKDEGNVEAYFGRGVVHLALNDTLNACRDWSAVLALGDTATYKLLESHCHGNMLVEDDVIPKSTYKQMFSMERSDGKVLSDATKARTIVEVMPQFQGGDAELLKYISSNLKMPQEAIKKNIHGTVYVNFIISSKGNILFPYVVRGIGGGCDEEALRIIKNMPRWKPGMQKGKNVLVRYNLPVKFN
ncbi:MAG: energy transducer TonB [Bacteroidota bacterium]